jgi:hypothetical protein
VPWKIESHERALVCVELGNFKKLVLRTRVGSWEDTQQQQQAKATSDKRKRPTSTSSIYEADTHAVISQQTKLKQLNYK